MLVVVEVGVDVVDVVVDFMFGMMLQLSMGVIVVVLENMEKEIGMN